MFKGFYFIELGYLALKIESDIIIASIGKKKKNGGGGGGGGGEKK